MYRVAILDDYQNVALQFADWSSLKDSVEITVFDKPFASQAEAVHALQDFEIVCAMRERTPFPREVLTALPKLKLLLTSGMRNASFELEAAKERGIIARLIDEGRSREQIIRHFLDKYPGESALVVPQDVGFNRLAWIFPVVIIAAALAALGVLARRWSQQARLSAASTKTSSETDRASYERRLDDDLDDMD